MPRQAYRDKQDFVSCTALFYTQEAMNQYYVCQPFLFSTHTLLLRPTHYPSGPLYPFGRYFAIGVGAGFLSDSRYCGMQTNKGAFLTIGPELQPEIQQFYAHRYTSVQHTLVGIRTYVHRNAFMLYLD